MDGTAETVNHVVIFTVTAPASMSPDEIRDVFSDAILEAFDRNREDPIFTDFECNDLVVEPA